MEHPSPLMTLVDEAMASHPGNPTGSWQRLAAEAPARCADAAQPELEALLRGAEHIALGHLDDADALLALDRKSTRLNSSHSQQSRMPSSA